MRATNSCNFQRNIVNARDGERSCTRANCRAAISGDQAWHNTLQKVSQPSALRITCKQHWQLFRDKLLLWKVKWTTSAISKNDARIWYPYKGDNPVTNQSYYLATTEKQWKRSTLPRASALHGKIRLRCLVFWLANNRA